MWKVDDDPLCSRLVGIFWYHLEAAYRSRTRKGLATCSSVIDHFNFGSDIHWNWICLIFIRSFLKFLWGRHKEFNEANSGKQLIIHTTTKNWYMRTTIQILKIRSTKRQPCCPAMCLPQTKSCLRLQMLLHLLNNYAHASFWLLFEGAYCFFAELQVQGWGGYLICVVN